MRKKDKEVRVEKAKQLLQQYTDGVPVICEDATLVRLLKRDYLIFVVSNEFTVRQFAEHICTLLKKEADKEILFHVH